MTATCPARPRVSLTLLKYLGNNSNVRTAPRQTPEVSQEEQPAPSTLSTSAARAPRASRRDVTAPRPDIGDERVQRVQTHVYSRSELVGRLCDTVSTSVATQSYLKTCSTAGTSGGVPWRNTPAGSPRRRPPAFGKQRRPCDRNRGDAAFENKGPIGLHHRARDAAVRGIVAGVQALSSQHLCCPRAPRGAEMAHRCQ